MTNPDTSGTDGFACDYSDPSEITVIGGDRDRALRILAENAERVQAWCSSPLLDNDADGA